MHVSLIQKTQAPYTPSPELRLAGCTVDPLGPTLLGLNYNVTVGTRAETQLWVAPHIVRKSILLVFLSQSGPLQQGQHKVLWGKDLAAVTHALYPCNKKLIVLTVHAFMG